MWLYCESEAKAAVASEMKQSFRKRFEDDLKNLSEGLAKPKARKKFIKVVERIGRLKEKHNPSSVLRTMRIEMKFDEFATTY